MFGFTSSSSAANLNGTPTRVDAGAGRLEPLRLGPLTRKPSSFRTSSCSSAATMSTRLRRCASAAVTFTRPAHHLLGEVAVAAVSLRQRAHVGGGVVADLAAEHLVLVAAAERDRRRRADVRLRRHRRHVRGLGDVHARGGRAGAVRATRRRPPASARAMMSLHDVAHRVVQPAGRVEPEDHDVGAVALRVVERLLDPAGRGGVDRHVELDRPHQRRRSACCARAGARPAAARRGEGAQSNAAADERITCAIVAAAGLPPAMAYCADVVRQRRLGGVAARLRVDELAAGGRRTSSWGSSRSDPRRSRDVARRGRRSSG